ncbi:MULTISPECIES: alpha/beta fold hydrolase [unclassified Streptomyces]|uniref:alpha/beta fold hydrolase n=1 Tax=unclassified Streptomyces TaxID=2593676 RepID=UPI000AED7569|nr:MULTISPECIES: hypothetical protein [unclassified Streptomyces]
MDSIYRSTAGKELIRRWCLDQLDAWPVLHGGPVSVLVARHSRSSGAPGAATPSARSLPRLVVTGEHDVFLPPRRLGPAVRGTLGAELGVVSDAGHLVVEERPAYLATLLGGPGRPASGGAAG